MDSANDWKDIVIWYAIPMKKMFNFDKTGLLFTSALLTKQWLSKNKLAVGKLSKERITVVVGGNMDGSDKLPLLVIIKSKNSQLSNNVKGKPVQYYENKKAKMTRKIFF